ncbi:MAG: hypothetical protein AAF089_00770 [Bacteroidota bacterium]
MCSFPLVLLLVSAAMIAFGVWEVRQPDVPEEEDLFGDERGWSALFRLYGYVLIALGGFGAVVSMLILTQG